MADELDSDEKTEEATPRYLEEARERGQVAQSTELVAALMLCAAGASLTLGGEDLARATGELLRDTLALASQAGELELGAEDAAALIEGSLQGVVPALLAVVLPVLAVGFLVAYGQAGFRVTPRAVAPELSKLDPIKGLRRMLSPRAVFRTLLAIAKLAVIAGAMVFVAWREIPAITRLAGAELRPALVGVVHVVVRCAAAAITAILVLALLDFLYQRWQHARDLRMTKQQVRDEHKNTEGDPRIKARVRAIQRELARRRMMAEVPKATVVVTNPTHFAIALRYARDGDGEPETAAPLVVAKGVDAVAERIKAVAREAGVPLYEDVNLARAMYPKVEIGQLIPEDLYRAVAVVIRYVYQVKGLSRGARQVAA
jgi:flagellar biosynthetic protein FlhB